MVFNGGRTFIIYLRSDTVDYVTDRKLSSLLHECHVRLRCHFHAYPVDYVDTHSHSYQHVSQTSIVREVSTDSHALSVNEIDSSSVSSLAYQR